MTPFFLAERDLYRPLWSGDIVKELRRNLLIAGIAESHVGRLCSQMGGAFLDAEVSGYEAMIDSMSCDEKDRHVLAAAVRADAGAIVTFNISDFPPQSTDLFEIDVIHPGDFLLDLLDLAPAVVLEELVRQAAANRRDPKTHSALLGVLDRSGVSSFADEIRRRVT